MKRIEITVSPQGDTAIEAKGFTGDQCQKASQFLGQALGKQTQEQLKPEFHVQVENEGTIEHNQ